MSPVTLQDNPSVESFSTVVATKTPALIDTVGRDHLKIFGIQGAEILYGLTSDSIT